MNINYNLNGHVLYNLRQFYKAFSDKIYGDAYLTFYKKFQKFSVTNKVSVIIYKNQMLYTLSDLDKFLIEYPSYTSTKSTTANVNLNNYE